MTDRAVIRETETDEVIVDEKTREDQTLERKDRREMERSTMMDNRPVALFPSQDSQDFRSRWMSIQTNFVDNPRESVQQADQLVAELMNRLTQLFTDEHDKLEQQWERGDNVTTEDLRVALKQYHSFFDRLLNM